jgi:acetoin utilization deacetylase AcuC-like enzyme
MSTTQRDTRRVGVVEDARYREHVVPPGHPECPERLLAVGSVLDAHRGALLPVPARPASDDELLRVHAPAHLARLAEASAHAPIALDADTHLGAGSLEVARLAAGSAIDLARAVCRGDLASGLAAVRPPGHHAEEARAMGFCVFNNVALAARALQAEDGVERVLVVDWDVHHGNGTQHSFEADPSVLYFSTHQFPYYPGTGDFDECGTGSGLGTTVNVPLPAGCADGEYVGVFQRVLPGVARWYRPDVVLVSAGFDAHRDDPLASMQVSRDGFAAMADTVRALADDLCGGRLVFVLEGGYAPTGLKDGVAATLAAALAADTPTLAAPLPLADGSLLAQAITHVRQVHGSRITGIGSP